MNLYKVNVVSKEQWRTGPKKPPVYYVSAKSKDDVPQVFKCKHPWEISRISLLGECITLGNVIWRSNP